MKKFDIKQVLNTVQGSSLLCDLYDQLFFNKKLEFLKNCLVLISIIFSFTEEEKPLNLSKTSSFLTQSGIWSPASQCEQESSKSQQSNSSLNSLSPFTSNYRLSSFYEDLASLRSSLSLNSSGSSGMSKNDDSKKERVFTVSSF